jgi:Protein of unknown function (DUF1573)
MRFLIIPVLVAAFLTGCSNPDKKAGKPGEKGIAASVAMDSTKFTSIQWLDSANKHFGKIAEGQKLEVSYRFKNTGNKPLVIQRVQPSCGCTVAEQPSEPVPPGEEGMIKASFNSEGRLGVNHKTLFVYANIKGSTSSELHFDVEVEKKKW